MIEFILILLVFPAGISLYKYIQPNHKIIKIDEQILKNKVKKSALLIGGKVSIVPYQTVEFQKDFFEVPPTVKIFEEIDGYSNK